MFVNIQWHGMTKLIFVGNVKVSLETKIHPNRDKLHNENWIYIRARLVLEFSYYKVSICFFCSFAVGSNIIISPRNCVIVYILHMYNNESIDASQHIGFPFLCTRSCIHHYYVLEWRAFTLLRSPFAQIKSIEFDERNWWIAVYWSRMANVFPIPFAAQNNVAWVICSYVRVNGNLLISIFVGSKYAAHINFEGVKNGKYDSFACIKFGIRRFISFWLHLLCADEP